MTTADDDSFCGARSEGGKALLRDAIRAGALVAGGPVPADFTKGWAHRITFKSTGMVAHYFAREPYKYDAPDVFSAKSACGLIGWHSASIPLMLPGNLPYCVRCERKLMKEMETKRP